MKLKSVIFIRLLVAVFLLSMVFQSWHTVQHTQSHQEQSQVKYFSPKIDKSFVFIENATTAEDLPDCHICDFVLGYFVAPTPFFIQFTSFSTTLSFPFFTPEIPSSFEGSLFSYRGPPQWV